MKKPGQIYKTILAGALSAYTLTAFGVNVFSCLRTGKCLSVTSIVRRLGIILFALFVLNTISAGQATFTWTGATNSNWNIAGNWTKTGTSTSTWPGENAGQTDNAVFNVNPAATIGSVPNIVLNSISVLNRNITLNSTSGSTITINNIDATPSLNVVATRTLTFGGGTAANAVNLTLQTITTASTITGTLTIAANSAIDCQNKFSFW